MLKTVLEFIIMPLRLCKRRAYLNICNNGSIDFNVFQHINLNTQIFD